MMFDIRVLTSSEILVHVSTFMSVCEACMFDVSLELNIIGIDMQDDVSFF